MRLSTNIFISESLSNTSIRFGSSLEKLTTGIKVNKASDDGSGLSIADKLRTQATSLNKAVDNGNSAIAMLQIADKSMAEQSKILDTIKAKLVQANTDTTSSAGREAIAKDISKLLEQLNNIGKQTNYNGRQLISGSNGTTSASIHTFQVGEKFSDTIKTVAISANTTGLSLTTLSSNVATATSFTKVQAATAQSAVNSAITSLNIMRADIGSTQNQIESAIRNLMTQATNIEAAKSAILDVDYAFESANFKKETIILNAGQFALTQANARMENILRLLQ
jgi:flagellin